MMQATKPWHGDDLAACIMIDLGFTPRRRSLCQCEMRSVLVVIADVLQPGGIPSQGAADGDRPLHIRRQRIPYRVGPTANVN